MSAVSTRLVSGTFMRGCTYPSSRGLGTALSRAKAQSWRDDEATMPSVANANITVMREDNVVPALMDPEPCVRISMKGKPVGVPSAALMSPMQ